MPNKHGDGPAAAEATRELERRAALLTLSDEPVGQNAVLALIRDALDRYVDVCAGKAPEGWNGKRVSFHPPKELLGSRGRYYLNGCDFTAMNREPVWDRTTQASLDVPNAALRLAARVKDNHQIALRLIETIEKHTASLESR